MITLAAVSLGLLLAVWLLYPLAIGLLASVRSTASTALPDGERPMVSVIIVSRESAAVVRERVENCLECEYKPGKLEVVVALDPHEEGPDPRIDELLEWNPALRVVSAPEPGGKALGLNVGVEAARGEILVFADSHQRFAPDVVRRLVAGLEDARFGAVSGRLELSSDGGGRSLVEYYWRMERWLRRQEARVHSSIGVTGAIYAMRRSLWQPLPGGLILDDLFVPMQLVLRGRRVGYDPAARAFETRRPSAKQEYSRKVRTLTGVLQLCAWLPAVLLPGRNPVWLQFVFHKLLRLLSPYLVLGVAAGVVVELGRLLRPSAPGVLAGFCLAFAAMALLRPRTVARLGSILAEGLLLQTAAIVATANGLRGRWNVWQR
jgi:cellulose synthase/poly-beta-1,6-N-acetylglucosamine synthase-like glycosyltransferase